MGNFEKLSVLVIVVIIVMILVVAIYTWTDNPNNAATTGTNGAATDVVDSRDGLVRGGNGLDADGGAPDDGWLEFGEGGENPLPATPLEVGRVPQTPSDDIPVDDVPEEPKVSPDPIKEEAPTSDEPWMYTIKSGDTITEIAMRELGTHRRSKEILKLNPDLDPLRLRVGQQIKMPPKGRMSSDLIKRDDAGGNDASVAVGSTSGPKAGEWYVTRRGDTLEKISKWAFRTIDYWPEIWAKNLKVLDSPDDITEGMRLFIPNVQPMR